MFYQLDDYCGVDTGGGGQPPSIMVPVNDYNLIVHDGNPDPDALKWKYGGPARAEDITKQMTKNVTAAHQYIANFVGSPPVFARSMVLLSAASTMQLGKQKRVIAITSSQAGDFELSVAGSPLQVYARNHLTKTLAFWIYQYTGTTMQKEWAALGGALDSNAYSKYLVEGLNKYFEPQANVSFERKSVADWKTELWPSPNPNMRYDRPIFTHKFDGVDYDADVRGAEAASGANIAVFVVPSIGGGANAFEVPKAGIYSVWVPWTYYNSQRIKTTANGGSYSDAKTLFIPEICHEVIHGLGGNHRKDRKGVMCHDEDRRDGSYLEIELLIDKKTLDVVNP